MIGITAYLGEYLWVLHKFFCGYGGFLNTTDDSKDTTPIFTVGPLIVRVPKG
jgi:hypothetical protein